MYALNDGTQNESRHPLKTEDYQIHKSLTGLRPTAHLICKRELKQQMTFKTADQ